MPPPIDTQQAFTEEISFSTHQPSSTQKQIDPLIDAIKTKNLSEMARLIQAGCDVNALKEDVSPLAYAIDTQNAEVIQLLLDAKANIEERDAFDQTPLIWFITQKNVALVSLLIQNKADVNSRDCYLNTPLIHAARVQSVSAVIFLLLQAGADIHAKNLQEMTAFCYAKSQKNTLLCKQLLFMGAKDPDEEKEPELLLTVSLPPPEDPEKDLKSCIKNRRPPPKSPVLKGENDIKIQIKKIEENPDYSDEVPSIARKLLAATQNENTPFMLYYNPFRKDIEDAIDMAINTIQEGEDLYLKGIQCLLHIIKQKYASIEEQLTGEQVRHMIRQKAMANGNMLPECYDYAEYDQDSIEKAISAYRADQQLIATDGDPLEMTKRYSVIRHRMPRCWATHKEYRQLKQAVRHLLPASYSPSLLEKIKKHNEEIRGDDYKTLDS